MARLKVGLENSLDYGMFAFVSRPLMTALRALHTVAKTGVVFDMFGDEDLTPRTHGLPDQGVHHRSVRVQARG